MIHLVKCSDVMLRNISFWNTPLCVKLQSQSQPSDAQKVTAEEPKAAEPEPKPEKPEGGAETQGSPTIP